MTSHAVTSREGALLGLSAGGFHRLAYLDWGDPKAERTLVCVHGLTRNARDFDVLAAALAGQGWRVVCADVVGRGRSAWLADPAGYDYQQYLADVNALLARIGAERVDWLGTSMGGLIGMMLAATPGNPVGRLVINDVGPFIPKAALQRIAGYLTARPPRFASLDEAEAHLREIHAPFGDLSDAQWRHLAEHSVVAAEGGFAFRYDPEIRRPFVGQPVDDVLLWPVWDAVSCPTLVLRGADSDLLLPETAAEMTRRGPEAALVEIPGCGHAPALMAPDQIAVVRDFLAA